MSKIVNCLIVFMQSHMTLPTEFLSWWTVNAPAIRQMSKVSVVMGSNK